MSQQIDQQACSRTLNGVYARERAAAQQATQAVRDPQWLAGYQSQPTYQPARTQEQSVPERLTYVTDFQTVAQVSWPRYPVYTALQEIGRLILDLNDHDMHRLSLALDIPPVSVDSAGWKLIGDK